MTIVELLQLKSKLSKKKSVIDKKISIINNLINTSRWIEGFGAKHETNRQNTTGKSGRKYR